MAAEQLDILEEYHILYAHYYGQAYLMNIEP